MKSALLLCLLLGAGANQKVQLVPVVVATVDIPAGTTVTMDMISQRLVEERFVTKSFIKPDSVSYVVNQKTLVPIVAGDLLRWVFFESHSESVCPTAPGTAREQLDHARGRVLTP